MGKHSTQKNGRKLNHISLPWKEILGFLGVILAAYIGYLGIRSQVEIPIQVTQTAEAKILSTPSAINSPIPTVNNLPVVTFRETLFFDKPAFEGMVKSEKIGVNVTDCWELSLPQYTQMLSPQKKVQIIYAFVVLSDKPMVISDIAVVLDKFFSPPDQSELKKGIIPFGGGGGFVTKFGLRYINIGSGFKRESLNDGQAYQVDGNDEISFDTSFTLLEPGKYNFHIEVTINTYDGKQSIVKSDEVSYSWMYADNLSLLDITDEVTNARVSSAVKVDCP